jgi:hypothetical protein
MLITGQISWVSDASGLDPWEEDGRQGKGPGLGEGIIKLTGGGVIRFVIRGRSESPGC